MYEFMCGQLMKAVPPLVILEVGGIGYRLLVPLNLFSNLGQCGKEVKLYTSYVIRDTGHQLFGFGSESDRDLFDQLTTVSGIGPKLALSLVGHFSPGALQRAVAQGDWKLLATTPGVGRKTAERLIVELRGRVVLTESMPHSLASDAIAALLNLGYTAQIAKRAVDNVLQAQESMELGALITSALKII